MHMSKSRVTLTVNVLAILCESPELQGMELFVFFFKCFRYFDLVTCYFNVGTRYFDLLNSYFKILSTNSIV